MVLSNSDASLSTQLIGIVSIGLFTVISSAIAWFVIKLVIGLRPTEEEEITGLDKSECGMDAYPEFN